MLKTRVELSVSVVKARHRIPRYIFERLQKWMTDVRLEGLEEVRKRPGYHDEPLKGQREGQRSIRLSRSYRAIYTELRGAEVRFVRVLEVTKHEY